MNTALASDYTVVPSSGLTPLELRDWCSLMLVIIILLLLLFLVA